jgi:NADPH:quinone reductase-like Zn-dependent oxidoreductase
VRIRVHAAAVNPTDILARNGSRAEQQKVDPPPFVPGMDVAGIVDQVGPGVETGVRVGDAVMGMVVPKGSHGGYREQIVLSARSVVRAPAGTSVGDGSAFTAVRGFRGAPQRGIRFSTTFVRTYDGQFEKLDRLRQLVEEGTIALRVAGTYPCERAADAHRRLEARGTRGRLVLLF